ncbi:MAG: M20/M25/M40 family metallo-hydrolase [Rhizobacter sp.]|nr:M20/M25/M40 family metallo-hydrolase [Ferruginibacter sp.]
MNKLLITGGLILSGFLASAQNNLDKIINVAEVERIERVLAADEMKGRKTFSPEIDKAADFIAAEFKKAGLQFFNGLTTYKQSFKMTKAKFISATGTINGEAVLTNDIIAVTTQAALKLDEKSGYKKIVIDTGANLMAEANKIISANEKTLVLVNTGQAKNFSRLKRFKRDSFEEKASVVFVLSDKDAATYSFDVLHEISQSSLANVIGILPGKSKKEELVVFSGHYDHIGIGKATADGDSVYNGANDDAAGTTAVMMLANYFTKEKNNERTLVFIAFTAEEIGGFGSQYFSRQINADKTVAMFNIEMIGTESQWGKNSAYITGYEKSDFGKILQGNLSGSQFHFEPDPYPKQNLFYRSDNATLAALGVPAHTISTSKMDTEKFYHTADDEIETLDMANMTEVIKAIAISSKGIVSGKETPSRVEKLNR